MNANTLNVQWKEMFSVTALESVLFYFQQSNQTVIGKYGRKLLSILRMEFTAHSLLLFHVSVSMHLHASFFHILYGIEIIYYLFIHIESINLTSVVYTSTLCMTTSFSARIAFRIVSYVPRLFLHGNASTCVHAFMISEFRIGPAARLYIHQSAS